MEQKATKKRVQITLPQALYQALVRQAQEEGAPSPAKSATFCGRAWRGIKKTKAAGPAHKNPARTTRRPGRVPCIIP